MDGITDIPTTGRTRFVWWTLVRHLRRRGVLAVHGYRDPLVVMFGDGLNDLKTQTDKTGTNPSSGRGSTRDSFPIKPDRMRTTRTGINFITSGACASSFISLMRSASTFMLPSIQSVPDRNSP